MVFCIGFYAYAIIVHTRTTFRFETKQRFYTVYAQVTHSRTGHRISHGYNQASFMIIRIGP